MRPLSKIFLMLLYFVIKAKYFNLMKVAAIIFFVFKNKIYKTYLKRQIKQNINPVYILHPGSSSTFESSSDGSSPYISANFLNLGPKFDR